MAQEEKSMSEERFPQPAPEEEASTIFSAPSEHNDGPREKRPVGKRLVAAALALLIVIGATVGVIKLIPEKEDEEPKDLSFSVLQLDTDSIEKAEIKYENSALTLLSTVKEENNTSTITWSVDGVTAVYTDSAKIKSAVSSAAAIKASKIVEGTESDFGLDKPRAEVTLTARNAAFETVTIKIGNAAPANMGCYITLSNDNKIYLADNSVLSLIDLNALDFATTAGLTGVIKTADNADCFSETSLRSFDYITLAGKNYPTPLKIEMQDDETLNAYFAFKITAPTLRIGNDDKITELITSLSSGIASSGAYAFDPDKKTLDAYRLDNPDAIITISVKGKPYTILASKVDDNFYAVVDSYGGLIHKIPASSLAVAESKPTDFYSTFIVLENLSGLSHFKANFANGESYDFQTIYNKENESYKALIGGKELDIDNFKALYRQFISLTPVEQDSKKLSDTALTLTLVHSDGSADTVLEFKPYSAARYQVEMNGIPMGLITLAHYDKFAASIKNVAAGNPVIE